MLRLHKPCLKLPILMCFFFVDVRGIQRVPEALFSSSTATGPFFIVTSFWVLTPTELSTVNIFKILSLKKYEKYLSVKGLRKTGIILRGYIL